MASIPLPAQDYINEAFSYDKISGFLHWKERPREHFGSFQSYISFNMLYPGKRAGTVYTTRKWRYLNIRLMNRSWSAHRIIYKMVTGEEPDEIDHIDRNGLNNAWTNLRPCTKAQNMQNRRSAGNKSGFRGVSAAGKRWAANISTEGVTTYLGLFDTPEEASAAYNAAAVLLHGEFAFIDSGQSPTKPNSKKV